MKWMLDNILIVAGVTLGVVLFVSKKNSRTDILVCLLLRKSFIGQTGVFQTGMSDLLV